MTLALAYDARTEVGLVRKTNQDSAYISPTMLMVADGMGGAAAGDLASAVAVNELERTDQRLGELFAAAGEADAPGSVTESLTAVLAGALARANERLTDLVDDDPALEGMGTTVCGVVLHGDQAVFVNIGDSRAYLLRDGELSRVTHDHSWVQTLVDSERLTEAQALQHPHRSLVMRVLNGSPAHTPDFHTEELRPGDRVMLCSDGLCGLVTDAALTEPLKISNRTEAIDALVSLAYEAGGHDNVTIVLADVEPDAPPGPTRTLGAAASIAIPETVEHTAALADLEVDAPEERAITEEERYALLGRRRPATVLKIALGFLLPVLALAAGAFAWYSYSQTQFFVGEANGQVAVFRGVPDQVPGLKLSTLISVDDTRLADLPAYYANQVRSTIRSDSQESAQVTVTELRAKAAACLAQRAARLRPPQLPNEPTAPEPSGLPAPWEPSPSPTPTILDQEC